MFEITYHNKVADDISALSTSSRIAVRKVIEEKLATKPEFFGKPLQFSLSGLRSLRVGDYRVVFQLKKKEVFIVLIAHRSVAYTLVGRRV